MHPEPPKLREAPPSSTAPRPLRAPAVSCRGLRQLRVVLLQPPEPPVAREAPCVALRRIALRVHLTRESSASSCASTHGAMPGTARRHSSHGRLRGADCARGTGARQRILTPAHAAQQQLEAGCTHTHSTGLAGRALKAQQSACSVERAYIYGALGPRQDRRVCGVNPVHDGSATLNDAVSKHKQVRRSKRNVDDPAALTDSGTCLRTE